MDSWVWGLSETIPTPEELNQNQSGLGPGIKNLQAPLGDFYGGEHVDTVVQKIP